MALTFISLLIGGILFWQANVISGTTGDAEFNQKLRDALAEINFANSNDELAIDTAADNLTNFIYYRSGIQLSEPNRDSLSQSEQSSFSQSKKISQSQLAKILTDVSFERLVTLTDSEINLIAETLRGFNPPGGLPTVYQGVRGRVKPRADGEGAMEPERFVNQIKASRDAFLDGKSAETEMTKTALHNRITSEISDRVNYLSSAEPSFFGGSKGFMTPMQALLIAYSVVTDDLLVGNQADLEQTKSELQQVASRFASEPYPGHQGYNAYGVNGYLYSSPTNFLLDDATTSRLIHLINQSVARQ